MKREPKKNGHERKIAIISLVTAALQFIASIIELVAKLIE